MEERMTINEQLAALTAGVIICIPAGLIMALAYSLACLEEKEEGL